VKPGGGSGPRDRVVYTTDRGRLCPRCGWPADDCHCASALAPSDETVPSKIEAKLRLENRASGKSVTIVDGLPRNGPFLESLARELKKACGTGGHAGDSFVELQGDQRERLRELLARKHWTIKG
jgi:translation initiation factor 1